MYIFQKTRYATHASIQGSVAYYFFAIMIPCRKSQGEKSVHNFGANQCDLARYCYYCPQNQESKHGSSVDYLQLQLFGCSADVHVFIGVCDFHRQNNPRIVKYQKFQYYPL